MRMAIASAEVFDKEHGGDPIVDGCWLLFADGSRREINVMGSRVVVNDPHHKAKEILRYWQTKHDLAAEEFANLKQSLSVIASTVQNQRQCAPPPTQDAIQQLKAIRKKVKTFKSKLKAAEANLENNIPEAVLRRQKQDAENRRECDNFLASLGAIEI